jgi:lysozyme family protein
MPRSDALLFRKIAEFVLKRQTSRPDPLSSASVLRGFISQAQYDAYRTQRGLSGRPVREVDAPEALSIILQTYWISGHAVEMPTEGLSILVLDAAFASGPKKAIELLQTAMVRTGYPVPEDGVFGAAMRKTLSDPATDVVALARSLIAVRREFLEKLASRNTSAARYVPAMLQTFDKLAADVEPLLAERKSVSIPSTATSAGNVEAEAGSDEKLTATQEQPPAIQADPEPNATPAAQASSATTPQPVSLVHPPQLPPQGPGSGSSDTAVSEWGIELPSLGERPSARWWLVFAMFVASALLAMLLRRRSR